MADYTPKTFDSGDLFEAGDATALSQQLDEEESRNNAQDTLISAAEESAEIAAAVAAAVAGTEESAEIIAAIARWVRPGGFEAGQYYFANSSGAAATSNGLGFGNLRLSPGILPFPVTIDRLGCDVATAGDASATFRPIIALPDSFGKPTTVLADGGDIAIATAGQFEVAGSVSLPAGLLWWGGVLRGTGTQPTLRVCNPACIPQLLLPLGAAASALMTTGVMSYLKGALAPGNVPNPLGVVSPSGTVAPRLHFRAA